LNGVIESGVLSDPDKFAKVAFACASTFIFVGERGVLACAMNISVESNSSSRLKAINRNFDFLEDQRVQSRLDEEAGESCYSKCQQIVHISFK